MKTTVKRLALSGGTRDFAEGAEQGFGRGGVAHDDEDGGAGAFDEQDVVHHADLHAGVAPLTEGGQRPFGIRLGGKLRHGKDKVVRGHGIVVDRTAGEGGGLNLTHAEFVAQVGGLERCAAQMCGVTLVKPRGRQFGFPLVVGVLGDAAAAAAGRDKKQNKH